MKEKIVIFLINVIIALANNCFGALPIPIDTKETVTFIFIEDSTDNLQPNGTGFFVGVINEKDTTKFMGYFVTAKHVLLDSTNQYYPQIYIRLNMKTGGTAYERIPLSGKDALKVYTHPDPVVDIAVIQCVPNQNLVQFKLIFDYQITTREKFSKLKIKEGDEVFFTGLFMPFLGVNKNYPIIRFGRISMITNEKIPDENGKMADLYLIEAQSFGGNSGSPVFFYLDPTREIGNYVLGQSPTLLLGGIMKGFFPYLEKIRIKDTKPIPYSQENSGIAVIVPAYYLYDILFSDELRNMRVSGK